MTSLDEGLAPHPSPKGLRVHWTVESSWVQGFYIDPDGTGAHRGGDDTTGMSPGDSRAEHLHWTSVRTATRVT
jgi:hypothetical protein